MVESRSLMRFNPMCGEMRPYTVFKSQHVYLKNTGVRHRMKSYDLWASPFGIVAYEDENGVLKELAILRPDQIVRTWNGPATVWLGTSPDLRPVTITYGDEDYAWLFLPCMKAVDEARHRTGAMRLLGPLSPAKQTAVYASAR